MRVLLLNQTFHPDQAATSQQLLDFARFLTAEGCEVTAVTSRRSYADPRIIHPAEEKLDGIQIVRVGSTGYGKRSFFHRFVDGLTFEISLLFRLLFFPRQDVVIAFTSPPLIGLAGVLFCAIRGGKCVQWMMDLNPDIAFSVGYLRPKSLAGRLLTAVFRFSARNSDFVVVLDRWMRQRLLAHGASADRIIVAPPWPVSEPTPADSNLGQRFRARHGITQRFVVLYSGNHSVAHPMDTVLETALAMREDPDVLFLFIGGGLRAGDVTRFRATHGLSNIRQMPYQPREQLSESLSAADLHVVIMGRNMSGLVHTSKIYGILSTGRPYVFIGPRGSHVSDLLQECPYGFQVDHGDVKGLVEGIGRTRALSPDELRTIFEHNTKYVVQNCSAANSLSGFFSRVIHAPRVTVETVSPQVPSRA